MSKYAMERGWMESEVWDKAPYSEREAWEWMIGEAMWKPAIINVNNRPLKLTRGQFSHSVRFMADKFQWTKKKVECYLAKLTIWEMVKIDNGTDRGTCQNIITVCNYDKYQFKGDGEGDTQGDRQGTPKGTGGGQEGDKEEEISKKDKEGKDSEAGAKGPVPISNLMSLELHPLEGPYLDWQKQFCPDIELRKTRDDLVLNLKSTGETCADYWPKLQSWMGFRQQRHNEKHGKQPLTPNQIKSQQENAALMAQFTGE